MLKFSIKPTKKITDRTSAKTFSSTQYLRKGDPMLVCRFFSNLESIHDYSKVKIYVKIGNTQQIETIISQIKLLFKHY
jgi:hypothetical protein